MRAAPRKRQTEAALTENQKERLADAPGRCRGIIRSAYTGSASAGVAIRAFCLQCTGYVRKDIAHCTAPACPLWAYRPYQTDDDLDGAPDDAPLAAVTTPKRAQNESGEPR